MYLKKNKNKQKMKATATNTHTHNLHDLWKVWNQALPFTSPHCAAHKNSFLRKFPLENFVYIDDI